ncbi:MAG: phosphodiester glycosidase family protein [Clostridia bacterium]|nr:phosphodiester glycosidase family protein [Clostridia bacterium]
MKKILIVLLCVGILVSSGVVNSFAITDTKLNGEVSRTTETLYEGVTCTHISLGADSKYNQQEFWVVEFDPRNPNFDLQVTGGGQYTRNLVTVKETTERFKEANKDKGIVPITAINGDLWMVAYAHARIEGKGTEYGGFKDAVVKHELTIPRGLDMYNGEIISSPHTSAETPFEGPFDAFGITPDGRTVLGTPSLQIKLKDLTRPSMEEVKITGLNRLPADKAIMIYSDKFGQDTAALDDAYEIVIDCDYDYVIKQDAVIKGKVTSIHKEGDENPVIKENRLVVTARGSKYIPKVEGINVGDEIEVSFVLKGSKKDDAIWQEVTNIVGGHIKLVVDGKAINNGDTSNYPAAIIGDTPEGNIMFLVVDGRQRGYSVGMKVGDMPAICKTLGYQNCFVLDGGGSATLVNKDAEGNYEVVNRPCDKFEDGTFGRARTVVNSIILSYIDESLIPTPEPDPTEVPTDTPAPEPTQEATPAPGPGCGSTLTGGSVLICAALALVALKKKKR